MVSSNLVNSETDAPIDYRMEAEHLRAILKTLRLEGIAGICQEHNMPLCKHCNKWACGDRRVTSLDSPPDGESPI